MGVSVMGSVQGQHTNMLGLFKDFGKKATDLNKKEFYDNFDKKATVKSSSDGVKFEAFATDKGKTEAQLNFKEADMEIKNKIDNNAVYTVEATAFKVMDGLDTKLIFATPAGAGSDACKNDAFFSSISLGSEYATADINSSSALKIKFNTQDADASAFAYKGWDLSSKNAFKVADDFTVGFGVGGITQKTTGEGDEKKTSLSIPEIKLGSTYKCGDMLLMAAVNGSFGGELKMGAISSSLFQQVNKETAIAAELEIKDSKVSAKFGSSYALAAGSTLKTKLTASCDKSEIDFAWIQKLNGNSSLTFAQKYSDGSSPKFSFAYTLG